MANITFQAMRRRFRLLSWSFFAFALMGPLLIYLDRFFPAPPGSDGSWLISIGLIFCLLSTIFLPFSISFLCSLWSSGKKMRALGVDENAIAQFEQERSRGEADMFGSILLTENWLLQAVTSAPILLPLSEVVRFETQLQKGRHFLRLTFEDGSRYRLLCHPEKYLGELLPLLMERCPRAEHASNSRTLSLEDVVSYKQEPHGRNKYVVTLTLQDGKTHRLFCDDKLRDQILASLAEFSPQAIEE